MYVLEQDCVCTHLNVRIYVCVLSATMVFTSALNLSGTGVSLFQNRHSHKLMWHFEPHAAPHTHIYTQHTPVSLQLKGGSTSLVFSLLSQLQRVGQDRFGGGEGGKKGGEVCSVCVSLCVCMWRSCQTRVASPSSCHVFTGLTSPCSLPCGQHKHTYPHTHSSVCPSVTCLSHARMIHKRVLLEHIVETSSEVRTHARSCPDVDRPHGG